MYSMHTDCSAFSTNWHTRYSDWKRMALLLSALSVLRSIRVQRCTCVNNIWGFSSCVNNLPPTMAQTLSLITLQWQRGYVFFLKPCFSAWFSFFYYLNTCTRVTCWFFKKTDTDTQKQICMHTHHLSYENSHRGKHRHAHSGQDEWSAAWSCEAHKQYAPLKVRH